MPLVVGNPRNNNSNNSSFRKLFFLPELLNTKTAGASPPPLPSRGRKKDAAAAASQFIPRGINTRRRRRRSGRSRLYWTSSTRAFIGQARPTVGGASRLVSLSARAIRDFSLSLCLSTAAETESFCCFCC